jgi:hypothetical protein
MSTCEQVDRPRPVRGTRLPRRRILKNDDDDNPGDEGGPSTSGTTKQRPQAPPGVQQRDNIIDNLVRSQLATTTSFNGR